MEWINNMILMNLFTGRDRWREQTCGHGGPGEAGTRWEIRAERYAVPCVKRTASGKLLNSTASAARRSGTSERGGMQAVGWMLKREGCMYTYSGFMLLYSRN